MKSLQILVVIVIVTIFVVAAWAQSPGPFTGPKNSYYITSWSSNYIFVVQGTSYWGFPKAYGNEPVLALGGSVRTRGSTDMPGPGGEYTLSGVPTGLSWPTPTDGGNRAYDGTSDGTSNYYVDHFYGVWRTDFYWQNPASMFCPVEIIDPQSGCWGLAGIAYDRDNNSLWISTKPYSWIGDYSLSGQLLSKFDVGHGGNEALAYDGTLWLVNNFANNELEEWSTTGVLLQRGYPVALPGYPPFPKYDVSGEIATPEPGTFMMLGAGLVVAAGLTRRTLKL